MKKIFLLGLYILCSFSSNAQLRVYSDGHSNIRNLVVNASDSIDWSNRYGIYSKYENFPRSSSLSKASIFGEAIDTIPYPWGASSHTMGVKGRAMGGRLSFGLYGEYAHDGNSQHTGAAIYGTVNSTPINYWDWIQEYGTNNYAGFFDGSVYTTGSQFVGYSLYVQGGMYGTLYGSVYGRGVSGLATEYPNSEERGQSITDQLSAIEMGTYYSGKESEGNTPSSIKGNNKVESSLLHYGLVTEQLEEAFPNLVIEDEKGNKLINYVEMVPLLVQSIRELSNKVATLEAQLGISEQSKSILKTKGKTADADDVTLTFPDNAHEATLNIYDLGGKLLRTESVGASSAASLSSYTHGLPTGTYVYSLTMDGRKEKARKVMVK